MLDHVSIQCRDLAASRANYEEVLAPLGAHATGEGFRESHIAVTAPDRAAVDAFCRAATQCGATVLHEPRAWPEYHAGYDGAFVRDPDGNNVEAVCHLHAEV